MSQRHQPLFIATVNYHLGHALSLHVAGLCRFLEEEGLERYAVQVGGLVPTNVEGLALGRAMTENGVDVAVGASTHAAIHQRSLGEDCIIVGGWRLDGPAGNKWYARSDYPSLAELRGARIGLREAGSMEQRALSRALLGAGVDPLIDVEWVFHASLYSDGEAKVAALSSGAVDVVGLRAPHDERARQEGHALVFDASRDGVRRPGRVIVASRRTIEDRCAELEAFLRANLRAFWYMRNPAHLQPLKSLEEELRRDARNDTEYSARLATSKTALARWPLPIDGKAPATELEAIQTEMLQLGELRETLPLLELSNEDAVDQAFGELTHRTSTLVEFERVRRIAEEIGY